MIDDELIDIACDQAWNTWLSENRDESFEDVLLKDIFRAGWEANSSDLVVLLTASRNLVDCLNDSDEIVDRTGFLKKLTDLVDRLRD